MDSLTRQINQVLSTFSKNVDETYDKVLKDVADEASEKLQSVSPIMNGTYAKGWVADKDKHGSYVVHNKDAYQLTHLLENGHDVVVNGKKVGHANAQPHIADVEAWVQEEAVKRLEDALK